ncbi:MAG: alanine racemase, partial [Phycisphaerae bacterium]|nr:alanine racemase [Phycisphaerae bacterium]
MQPQINVEVHLGKIRQNVQQIRQTTGVPVIAVIKADAYGTGIVAIVNAIDDLVDGYYVFEPREVIDSGVDQLSSRSFIAAVCHDADAQTLRSHRIRPAVWSRQQADRWRACDPVLSVDTGQQRFACQPQDIDAVLKAGNCREAFTHASNATQAGRFDELTCGRGLRRHAAGTSLLHCPTARFDAVRPGLAVYRGAVRVSTRLVEARDSLGPAGYSGFVVPRHGVIFGGYSDGLTGGICLINGVKRRILEVGMQSSFVELGPHDRAGDEVVLLGDSLTEADAGNAWRCGAHEALY